MPKRPTAKPKTKATAPARGGATAKRAKALTPVEPPVSGSGLTLKQELFVESYLGEARGNGTQAARLAGYEGSDETLRAVAYENLTKPHIVQAIRSRLDSVVATTDRVLVELSGIAFAPPEGFTEIRYDRNGDPVDVTLDLKDKLKALELIGRHRKMFTDKRETTSTVTLSTEDKRRIVAEVMIEEMVRQGATPAQARAKLIERGVDERHLPGAA